MDVELRDVLAREAGRTCKEQHKPPVDHLATAALNGRRVASLGAGTFPAIVSVTNRTRGPDALTIARPALPGPDDRATMVSRLMPET